MPLSRIRFWKYPDDTGALNGKEWRFMQHAPIRVEDGHFGEREEFFLAVELILQALVAADVEPPAYLMRGGLDQRVYGNFGDHLRIDLSFVIILG